MFRFFRAINIGARTFWLFLCNPAAAREYYESLKVYDEIEQVLEGIPNLVSITCAKGNRIDHLDKVRQKFSKEMSERYDYNDITEAWKGAIEKAKKNGLINNKVIGHNNYCQGPLNENEKKLFDAYLSKIKLVS